ncbi:MAG: Asp-tRNA(Asn)/Glu-tRNA(Gln) amidotransferase subunit GatA [Acidimicrobiia bacterium]|nr:Asp-tRNA(Asn)/Glu-tRNA(Gln) amidotransferase subunit GatA [Acidimicrobiia bacterium]
MTDAITSKTAAELAGDFRDGTLSASEIVDAHLDRIEALNPELNAFLYIDADRARRRAADLDAVRAAGNEAGALAGVPIGLKDLLCTEGIPTTAGSKILKGWRPPYDATVVSRLEAQGAISLGKLNMDEFAMGSSNENSAYGSVKNPWDTSKVPGGSSGGSAAAVAAGMVPLALGSDTGGSIRQPAALCGVVGVKPTYGRVSRYGVIAFASSLDQIGPFGRTVADAAFMLEAIWGYDHFDSTSIEEPPTPVGSVLDDGVQGLRVGVISELANTEGLQPEVAAALQRSAGQLAAAGAIVDEVSVPSIEYGLSAYYLIAPAEASSNLARYDGIRYGLRVEGPDTAATNRLTRAAGFGDEVKRRIMLGTYALSAGYYDAFYGKAQQVRTLIIDDFARAYERFDVLLSPTSPTTAFGLGDKVDDPLAMYLSDVCTIATNLAGAPAMSVPVGKDAHGLPIGMQILAPALGERPMFQAGAALEAAASFNAAEKTGGAL